uniref:Eukaryotic translation initiation factor 3 subunit M n=1 Tax=Phallusia mammillata TaxID=59560 RepID=A0A6F9DCJ4_9ASCI|nr:eukaryotic translation initiation factor 3 subunit M-like [Phallusia mammillata]
MNVPAFIDLSESDQVNELRQYFNSRDVKIEETAPEDLFGAVKSIINATSKIWNETDPKDIEGIVNSILSLLFIIPLNQGKELVDLLCEQLLAGRAEAGKNALSMKLLHNLFHGYQIKTPFLYKVYCTWIKVAGLSGSLHLLPTNLKEVNTWLEYWDAGEEGRQNLYRLLYQAHYKCGSSDEAAETMIRLLEGYTDDNAAQARDDAIKCITRAIADQNTYLFDQLLTLKPVNFLEGELIYDLLNIFVSGNVNDYKEFYASNNKFFQNLGLSHESNLRKIQLLTLVDIVGVSREIGFDEIVNKLGLSHSEVEDFVIDAMQSKLIRARIDHVNRKILVSQACQRTFGRPQWQILHTRLQQWKDNLKRVNEKLSTVSTHA